MKNDSKIKKLTIVYKNLEEAKDKVKFILFFNRKNKSIKADKKELKSVLTNLHTMKVHFEDVLREDGELEGVLEKI